MDKEDEKAVFSIQHGSAFPVQISKLARVYMIPKKFKLVRQMAKINKTDDAKCW